MSETIRARAEIPSKYKWNAASVYPSDEAWEAEADLSLVRLEEIKRMERSVGQNAATLADALDASNALFEVLGKVLTYSFNAQAVDNADANAAHVWEIAGNFRSDPRRGRIYSAGNTCDRGGYPRKVENGRAASENL